MLQTQTDAADETAVRFVRPVRNFETKIGGVLLKFCLKWFGNIHILFGRTDALPEIFKTIDIVTNRSSAGLFQRVLRAIRRNVWVAVRISTNPRSELN